MNGSIDLHQFCSGQFLDISVVFNQTVPIFSDCFQTVTILIAVLFFVACLPIFFFKAWRSKSSSLIWSTSLISKLICQLAVVVCVAVYFRVATIAFQKSPHILFVSYDSILAVLLLCHSIVFFCCILYCKRSGIVSSGCLFVSLIVLTFCCVPALIAKTNYFYSSQFKTHIPMAACFIVLFMLLILQIVLLSFADRRIPSSDVQERNFDHVSSPENNCSFLNKITFWWFTSVCIVGWRRPLTLKDMFQLNDNEKSVSLTKPWNKHWIPRLSRYMARFRSGSLMDTTDYQVNEEKVGFVSSTTTAKLPEIDKQINSVNKHQPSIVWCLFLTFKTYILPATALKTIADIIQFANPLLLNLLITFIQNRTQPLWVGCFYASLMFGCSMTYTLLLHRYFDLMLRFGMNMRTVLTAAVFDKVLKLSSFAQRQRGIGQTVNIMSIDIQSFQDSTFYLNMVISNPLQICLALYLLWRQLGPAVLAGVTVMIVLLPINYFITTQQRKYQVKQMRFKDERIRLMSEILTGIKVLKLYAWEESFEAKVLEIRRNELRLMRKSNFFHAFSTFVWSCAPVFVSVATFAVYILVSKEPLTPQRAFVSLTLFNILRFPMSLLPAMISVLMQASVSNDRLKSFLCAEEMDTSSVDRNGIETNNAVTVKDGSFSWNKAEPSRAVNAESSLSFTLSDINLDVDQGQLVAIVGKVGSGKSSLLSALLGEMEKVKGTVTVCGSVAYVSQQAWIQNMTLKDNILFSSPFKQKLYDKAIGACCLDADLKMLPASDMTEIGEKGINLSGGQKQRVSLARAVYSNSDIYLLDDPLSAVDAHVGKNIFRAVLSNQGILRKKTRIVVTHGLHYLKNFDKIFVLDEGRISESGTYQELLNKGGIFANILINYLNEKAVARKEMVVHTENVEDQTNDEDLEEALKDIEKIQPDLVHRLSSVSDTSSLIKAKRDSIRSGKSTSSSRDIAAREKSEQVLSRSPESSKKEKSRLIAEEAAETGKVRWTVYAAYFSAMGYISVVACTLLTILSQVFNAVANFWLTKWTDAALLNLKNDTETSLTTESPSNQHYLGVYVSLAVVQGLFVLLSSILLAFATITASRELHLNLIQKLFRIPLSFFDTTPFGRILNRCGKDIDIVDSALASTVRTWIACVCAVVTTIAVICIAIYYFAVVVVPLFVLYYFVLRFYVSTSRQLKRLESVTRSPIYSHFQESISGITSIRAYRAEDKFRQTSYQLTDQNQSCYYATLISNRWLAVRLEFIGNSIIFFTALFAVLGRENLDAGQVGLAVSYALGITQVLNWAVRMTSDLESNIVSVERIKEYSEIESEAPWKSALCPANSWPNYGSFVFENFGLKYRPELDFVLKDLNFVIDGGQKIGIVGRTGAGKSSLTLALFRIVEPSTGRILLDNQNVAEIGLHDLRSKLTIIPQDPILFSTSFRFNLDPFDKYSDEEIWAVLDRSHLKSFVSSQHDKLDFKIEEGGGNLSVGQRQLVCLARALLRKTKVLILDEATAAVDLETDDLIQKSIRSYFADCTVLTIAHRLNTIMDSDKILVLSDGKMVEFDTPNNLLRNRNSLFHSLAVDAGLAA